MFPDLESDIAGGAVGILIPETVTHTEREIFESLLTEMTTAFKTQVGGGGGWLMVGMVRDTCVRRR